jgi:threonine dehydrogenase-like Zn-dependent dehydrogenase
MRGLVVDSKGELSVAELPLPEIGPYQARVRLLSCGVCNGTDMKLIHGAFKNFNTYPAVLGHEGVGEVVAVGEKAKSFYLGDRVLLPFLEGMSGIYHSGWGAYSEYAVVGDAQSYIFDGLAVPSEAYFAQTVLKKDDKVDAVGAAMIITFREVLSALRRFQMKPNKNMVVFGAGPVGLCFIRFAKLIGMGTVYAIDIDEEKVNAAKSMGADESFNSLNSDVNLEIRKRLPMGADYVVDAVGVNALINQAMGLIADHGKICCYGISPKLNMDLDWSRAPYNWSLDFVQWPSKLEEAEAHSQIMTWINMGVLDPMDFISDVVPFDRILDAFRILNEKRKGTKKIVIQY